MPKKRRPPEREGNQYIYAWSEAVNDCNLKDLDLQKIKRLIYDTYIYFSRSREYNSVLREDLPIYKYMNQFCGLEDYPGSWKASEYDTCVDFVQGLCLAVERGFEAYGHLSLSLSYGYHAFDSVVSMSSYESYEKAFEEEMEYFREEYAEDA